MNYESAEVSRMRAAPAVHVQPADRYVSFSQTLLLTYTGMKDFFLNFYLKFCVEIDF
jgi:hypothetical protein